MMDKLLASTLTLLIQKLLKDKKVIVTVELKEKED